MISLFILKPIGRGVRYGIGTYLKQLTDSLLKYEDVNILVINYMSERYKEFTIISEIPRYTDIYIPPTVTQFKYENQDQKYANRIVDFLLPIIAKTSNPVFQVNYLDAISVVKALKSRTSTKIISVVHTAQWQFNFNGNKKKFLEVWNLKQDFKGIQSITKEKNLYELSDKIITVTSYMKRCIIDYYNIPGDKINVIYNGINNLGFFTLNNKDKEKLKQSFGFNKEEKIVLYCGRLDKGKGLTFLFDAFYEVIGKYNNVRLVIAGDVSGKEDMSHYLSQCNKICGKITFTGFLETEFIKMLYQITDIGVIPSLYENCSYAAIEMIGYNIPLIISNIEGLNEILNENQSIYLIPSIDDEGDISFSKSEISSAILMLLKDENSITKNITNNYNDLISTRFSSDLMGKEYYSLLSSF